MQNYSQIISTIYDETHPVSSFGHRAHYSVLRSITCHDNHGEQLKVPKAHDFGVIWDKDHDIKIIDFVEHLYLKNLLTPVLFLGERDGVLSVLVSAQCKEGMQQNFHEYVSAVAQLAKSQYEPWNVEVCIWGESLPGHRMIDSDYENVDLYLKNIQMLWNLGLKDLSVCLNRADLSVEPEIEII